jgi:Bardet-Biedl syndrome 9 protein
MRLLYENSFDRNAFNFCVGTFGKSGKEMICVQSVDGMLYFYEYENFIFNVQLPDFLIPGPIIYSPNIDSIIVSNSSLELECYKFSSLNGMANSQGSEKKFHPDWLCILGEQAS